MLYSSAAYNAVIFRSIAFSSKSHPTNLILCEAVPNPSFSQVPPLSPFLSSFFVTFLFLMLTFLGLYTSSQIFKVAPVPVSEYL